MSSARVVLRSHISNEIKRENVGADSYEDTTVQCEYVRNALNSRGDTRIADKENGRVALYREEALRDTLGEAEGPGKPRDGFIVAA